MSDLQRLLLIGLAAIAVRFAYLHEIQESPFLSGPGGVASLFAGVTPDRDSGLDQPSPRAPLYTRVVGATLRIGEGDPTLVFFGQAAAGTAACLLIYLLSATLFSRAIGLAAGLAAAFYGPSICFVGELTPTTWSTLLGPLFLLSVARPPVQKPVCRWTISALLLALVLVESLPFRNLPALGSLAGSAPNLFHLVQGRELLPDLDPYLISGHSAVIGALLWDRWLAFPFGVILPLAIPGLVLFGRSAGARTTAGRALLLFVFASAVVFGLLAPDARQRLPLALLMLPFAALAVEDLWKSNRRAWKTAGILFLVVACNLGVKTPAHLAGAAHHHYWMGVACARQGMTAHAAGAYRRAVEKMPAHKPATRELAKLYLDQGRPEEALTVCAEFLRSHPEAPEILLLQGDGYAATGRMDEAVFSWEQVRARGAPSPGLLVRLGEAYRAMGRIDRASAAYAEAVAARPDSTPLRYQLAQLYDRGGQTDRAIEQYRALLSENPGNHLWHARLGGALLERALEDSLFEVDSTSPVDAAQLQEAETHLREAIRLRPDHLGARQLLALLLTRRQRHAEAIAHLEYVREEVPDDPYPHLLLGMLKERVGKEAEARRHRETYARLSRGKQLESVAKAGFARLLDGVMPNLQPPR